MVMLALDTATDAVSVALLDGPTLVAGREVDGGRRHVEVLAPLIADLLQSAGVMPADVTAVAVGCGPGAFTGLRIGIASAVTFAYSRGIPVYGVGTLDAVAREALHLGLVGEAERFAVALDARRREVFWAVFEGSTRLTPPAAAEPAPLAAAELQGLTVFGDSASAFPDVFPTSVTVRPTARAVAELAYEGVERGEAMLPIPIYVRSPDATMPGPRKRVTPDTAR